MNQPHETLRSAGRHGSAARGRGPTWKLPLLLGIAILVLVLIALARRRSRPSRVVPAPRGPAVALTDRTVRLHIVFGNGTEKQFSSLPWRSGLTVAQALDLAAERPPGLNYAHRGNGTGALLTRIDAQTNEGPGDNSRNWIYRINGRLADKSYAAYVLQPGDVILWTFSKYE